MGLSDKVVIFLGRNTGLLCLAVLLLSLLIVLCYFARRLRTFEIATISTLSAISIAGRMAFFFIPFFKPCTAIIIISGSVYGPGIGSLVGVLTGLLSNIAFGQGTWTPFQMFCWGLIGFLSGFLGKSKFIACIFGVFTTIVIYGGIMNFYSMLVSGNTYSTRMFYLFEIHGLPVDTIHAIATIVFLCIGWNPLRKKLLRLKTKYGVLSKEGMYKTQIKEEN